MNSTFNTGDCILFDTTGFLNIYEDEDYFCSCNLCQPCLNAMGGVTVFKFVTKNEVEESFLVIVRYGLKYFNMKNVDAVQFWGQIMSLQDDHLQWKPVLLLIEVCPCAPHSNATLEKLL